MVAPEHIKGQNFECIYDGVTIKFFGAEGMRNARGDWGFVPRGKGYRNINPTDNIMDRVQDCIKADIKAGKGQQIAQVQLNPDSAVKFYLAGHITLEHMRKVEEKSKDFIDIPNVEIQLGRLRRRKFILTVRVLANTEDAVATADRNGVIL